MVESYEGFEKELNDLLCKKYKTQKVKLSEINSKEQRTDKKYLKQQSIT